MADPVDLSRISWQQELLTEEVLAKQEAAEGKYRKWSGQI